MLFPRGVRRFGFSALLLPLLVGGLFPVSCSSKDEPQPAPAAYVARFDLPKNGGAPDLLQVPFPSDLMLAKDGTIVLPETDGTQGINKLVPSEKGAKYIVEAFAKTHGFGTYAG